MIKTLWGLRAKITKGFNIAIISTIRGAGYIIQDYIPQSEPHTRRQSAETLYA